MPNQFFHGSTKKLNIGDFLVPQKNGYVSGECVDDPEKDAHFRTEKILELYKPETAISRLNSVFMVADPDEIDAAGGYTNAIYIVEPEGTVLRCNMAWYSELYCYCFDENVDENIVKEIAKKYWAGTPKGEDDLFEFLCKKAKIISVYECDEELCP